jgi:hypothetical protein
VTVRSQPAFGLKDWMRWIREMDTWGEGGSNVGRMGGFSHRRHGGRSTKDTEKSGKDRQKKRKNEAKSEEKKTRNMGS